jgi:hypothetical protein
VPQQCIRALADSLVPVSVPGCSLHAHARRTTSGEVKKYQQAFLASLPGTVVKNLRTRLSSYLLFTFFISTFTHVTPGRLSLYAPSAHYE